MDRDARVGPRTATVVKVGLALMLWSGILALVKLTLAVF
jgi:hypothetical protein